MKETKESVKLNEAIASAHVSIDLAIKNCTEKYTLRSLRRARKHLEQALNQYDFHAKCQTIFQKQKERKNG